MCGHPEQSHLCALLNMDLHVTLHGCPDHQSHGVVSQCGPLGDCVR